MPNSEKTGRPAIRGSTAKKTNERGAIENNALAETTDKTPLTAKRRS